MTLLRVLWLFRNMKYIIHKTADKPSHNGQWESAVWQQADVLHIEHFHPCSSGHRPTTDAKLLYDNDNLYVLFRVADQYVKAVYTEFQDPVCNDSCVEFFVMPTPLLLPSEDRTQEGYFNFEINCIGTMLLYYIEDPIRTDTGFQKSTPVTIAHVRGITIFHSLSGVIKKEIATPTEWYIEYNIPFSQDDIKKVKKSLISTNVNKTLSFDPKVDTITSATITTGLVFDSINKGSSLFNLLREKGFIQ